MPEVSNDVQSFLHASVTKMDVNMASRCYEFPREKMQEKGGEKNVGMMAKKAKNIAKRF